RKTDIAIWRGKNNSTSGSWQWIRSSDGTIGGAQLGTGVVGGDYPVQGDYDGDGKTDPAIFRTGGSSGVFQVLGSQRGFYSMQWGWSGDGAPLFDLQAR
ncbi:MAG: hypothetical protein M3384_21555, partial [Acidobacteriota bacterium]|nr:hypothetical protein [Acidobacteriota bacterium]